MVHLPHHLQTVAAPP